MTTRMRGELRPKKEVIGTAPAMRAIPLTLEKMPFACRVRRSKHVVDVCDGDVVCVAMCENLSRGCRCFAVLTIGLKYLPVPGKPLPNAASFSLTCPEGFEIPLPLLARGGDVWSGQILIHRDSTHLESECPGLQALSPPSASCARCVQGCWYETTRVLFERWGPSRYAVRGGCTA